MVKEEKKTAVKKNTVLSVAVFNIDGKEKKTIELNKNIFDVKVSPSLLAQAVRVYLANQRAGTASSKTRSEVVGSTRKIYRQKGTGKARHGSLKAPIFVGGGVVGGPKPRDYSLSFSKNQRRLSFLGALTNKAFKKDIICLEEVDSKNKLKTKNVSQFLKILNLTGKKIIFVLPSMIKNNFVLASRNIEKISILPSSSLNTYEVLKAEKIIFFETAIKTLEKHFLNHEN
ncbi:MAG: 50S ribosomal protein L4 [Candidatus Roizmanbacteria bacterium GW2011_GWA2_35_19]|uniref:Large ribosomal subunit protein uL4 n=1 Tax=Candidatus Roizmanbacteria bacterium GW2011_GWA2_35_19 TaxID=1618478 RepID=A0A0G0C312_9BACT|nr:MAG: 50S ribosomal protein L4 [Candidatus Roizmanbacteria bacterium GW2011_GWA2_35_19]